MNIVDKVRITFTHLIQDSQDLGSDDDHMISRVYFNLEYGGSLYQNLYVDVKQTVGGDIDKTPLEVGRVIGYSGPGNYAVFREAVEKYFRSLVGSSGRGIRISGGSNIRMRNNTFVQSTVVEFPVSASGGW